MELNTDLTASHARFTGGNLTAFGLSGDHIPNAPGFVGSFGALLDKLGPWFGGLEVRALGQYPLTDNNKAKDAGYKLSRGVELQLYIFNLFNVRANSAAYDYTSRLQGEPLDGVTDHQNHSLEPLSARLVLAASF